MSMLVTGAFVCVAGVSKAWAQATHPDSASAPEAARVTVTPGARYRAGWLHKAILGSNYRSLWKTSIEVDIFDLDSVAGGLRPTQRGGSMQTNSLRFLGANGREYVFRPIEKDFGRGLPEEIRETLVRDIAQDLTSGQHPASALITARLLDATGLHHARPRLGVMPDAERLGEFRTEFANVVGTLEERPGTDFDETPESLGATTVVSSARLFERMQRDPDNAVNARAFLTARLFDILVGDRDRHRDQWRWGRFSSGPSQLWEPIPRDRDFPFARFEGVGSVLMRGAMPQLVTFTKSYPDMVWLNWNAREIDRRLLVSLERPVWDSVARELQLQVTDAVIDSALAEMPPPFLRLNGGELREALVRRRARLPLASRDYYRVLAREVDLSGTDDRDVAEITRGADGSVSVAMFSQRSLGQGAAGLDRPYLRRRFAKGETRETRVFLFAGDDRVIVRGSRDQSIIVRIVGGEGEDTVVDSVPGGDPALRFYDSSGGDRFISDVTTGTDRTVYTPPPHSVPQHATRDWGEWSYTHPAMSTSPGVGLVTSVNRTRIRYGFRNDGYLSRSVTRLDVSLTERRPRFTYSGTFRPPTSNVSGDLQLTASGLELIRFHGYGNETPADRSTSYYRVFQNLFRVEPGLVVRSGTTTWSLGAVGQYSSTRDGTSTLIGETNPYGSGTFGEVGAKFGLVVDRRDSPAAPTTGFRFSAGGALYPAIWDVTHAFGEAHVGASTYASASWPLAPTLALRAGAQHVWGTFPVHDAAFLGGNGTLRGWPEQRFAGRSTIFGSTELRLLLARVLMIVPTDVGLLTFADVGRVVADGDRSNAWHSGFGGGIWLAPLRRAYTVSVSVARGREDRGLYLRSGFTF
jgi:hypothetical protein